MADVYNMTLLQNKTSMYEVTSGLNTMSGGLFAILFIIVSVIVIMIMLKNYDYGVSSLSAFAFGLFEGVIFFALGMISIDVVLVLLGLLIVSVGYLILSK